MKMIPLNKPLNRVLDEWVEDEQIWDELFSRPESEVLLERLADETLQEFRAGKTRDTDPGTA